MSNSDPLSPAERSERMSRVRDRNTKPEMQVRRMTHAMGYRYKLHDRQLPGKPDMVFPRRGKVIFVHGCFWHLHENCRLNRPPKSRVDYWLPKLERNKARDLQHQRELEDMGWSVLVVWECELRDTEELARRIDHFLASPNIH